MGRSLSAPAIIGRAPTSNGFARRKIINSPGAFNFQLPNDVSEFDMAIFGAGGGGALRTWLAGTQIDATPGGGAGGGFCRRKFSNANGGLITGVVGAPGVGGKVDVPSGAGTAGMAAGSNGGTTTATFNGATLTATGGAGAGLPNQGNVIIKPVGGIGSGGDLNSNGGKGGSHFNPNGSSQVNFNTAHMLPGGGGASGSHRGDGGSGGNARWDNSSNSSTCGAGGGWGGDGADGFSVPSANYPFAFGGGSMGPGLAYEFAAGSYDRLSSLFLGMGSSKFAPIARQTSNQGPRYDWEAPIIEDWWDIADMNGWSGGWLTKDNFIFMAWPAGPGAGGGANYGGRHPVPPGFGGGAPGITASTDQYQLVSAKAAGGVGAGGSGRVVSLVGSDAAAAFQLKSVYGGYGGPGCVIIWY